MYRNLVWLCSVNVHFVLCFCSSSAPILWRHKSLHGHCYNWEIYVHSQSLRLMLELSWLTSSTRQCCLVNTGSAAFWVQPDLAVPGLPFPSLSWPLGFWFSPSLLTSTAVLKGPFVGTGRLLFLLSLGESLHGTNESLHGAVSAALSRLAGCDVRCPTRRPDFKGWFRPYTQLSFQMKSFSN